MVSEPSNKVKNKEEDYYESDIHGAGRIYSSEKITDLTDTVLDLRDEKIYWEDVGKITIPYDDLYDIHYLTGYNVEK